MSERRAKRTDHPIPTAVNLALAGGFLVVGLALVLLLPLGLAESPVLALLLLPFSLATPTLWALIHEAIHGSLHPHRRVNDALGRALCVMFGAPLTVLRFGHLTHHRLYRNGQEEIVDPRTRLPRALGLPLYYLRILGGVYLAEVAAAWLSLLPRRVLVRIAGRVLRLHPAGSLELAERIEEQLLAPAALWRLRQDALTILALYGAGFYLYGDQGWMLLAALLLRGALVSFMDNIYHHRPVGAPRRTTNLRLPSWAARAILNANLHAAHHARPGLPWIALPALAHSGAEIGLERGLLDAALEQLARPAA